MADARLSVEVRRRGNKFPPVLVTGNPKNTKFLRAVVIDTIRRDGWDAERIGEFEATVRYADDPTHSFELAV
jgi:hypothetical protein